MAVVRWSPDGVPRVARVNVSMASAATRGKVTAVDIARE
jgi:hypothetical protein